MNLEERLVDTTNFQDYLEIVNKKELKPFFSTPMKDLFKKSNELGNSYRYAFDMKGEDSSNLTLAQVLSTLLLVNRGRIKLYFSESNEIEGFIMYTVGGTDLVNRWPKYVEDIIVMSFDLDRPNMTLTGDLYHLILDLRSKYRIIRWIADENNPATKFYKKIVDRYGGVCERDPEDNKTLVFKIPGKGDPFFRDEPLKEKRIPLNIPVGNDLLEKHILEYFLKKKKSFDKEFKGEYIEEAERFLRELSGDMKKGIR